MSQSLLNSKKPYTISIEEAYVQYNKLDDTYEKLLYGFRHTDELDAEIREKYSDPILEKRSISAFRDLFHVQIFGGFAIYKWLEKLKGTNSEIRKMLDLFMTSPYITTDDIDIKIFATDNSLVPGSLANNIIKYYADDIYEFIKNIVDTNVDEDYKPLSYRFRNNTFGNYYKFIKKSNIDIVYMVKKKIPALEIYERFLAETSPDIVLEYAYLTNNMKPLYKLKKLAREPVPALNANTKATLNINNKDIPLENNKYEKVVVGNEQLIPMIAPLNLVWASSTHMLFLGLIALILNRKSNRVISIIKLIGRMLIVNQLMFKSNVRLFDVLVNLLIRVDKLNEPRGEFNKNLINYVKTLDKDLGARITETVLALLDNFMNYLLISDQQITLINMFINHDTEFKRDIHPTYAELIHLNNIFPKIINHPDSIHGIPSSTRPDVPSRTELSGGAVLTKKNRFINNTHKKTNRNTQKKQTTNTNKQKTNLGAVNNEYSSELDRYFTDNPTPADIAINIVIRENPDKVLAIIKNQVTKLIQLRQ